MSLSVSEIVENALTSLRQAHKLNNQVLGNPILGLVAEQLEAALIILEDEEEDEEDE